MDVDGLEDLSPSSLVLLRRPPLGLHRHNTSRRVQLGWLDDLPFLLGCG